MPQTLFAALARFQADLPRIVKGSTAKVTGKEGKPGYQYDYADLADVSDAVLKRIGSLGLFFTAWPLHREEDGKFGLAYTLGHVSGERQDGWWELRSDLPMQQMGGMITYARRYILLAVTGAAPAGEDDDAASTQHVPSRQPARDPFEEATPARPQQGPGLAWYRRKLAEADTVKTEAAGQQLAREAAEAARDGLCTPDQATHVQHRIRARTDRLRASAEAVDVEDLAQDAHDTAAGNGTDRHKRLAGAVQGHMHRLGFQISENTRAERMAILNPLARTSGIESTSDFDDTELKAILDALAKCKDQAALAGLLAEIAEGAADATA
jgi:hypothetical protein